MTIHTAGRADRTPLATVVGVLWTKLGRILIWFVPIVLIVPVVLHVLVSLLGGELDGSDVTLGIGYHAPMWFLFAMGATLLTQHLPVHVAHGMTRRRLASALTVTLLTAAAFLAGLVPVGMAVETATREVLGWTRVPTDVASVQSALPWLTLTAFVRLGAMASIGMLAATAYYRWGSIAMFAVVAAPGFTVLYALGEAGAALAPSARLGLGVTAMIVAITLHHALIRNVSIRAKPT